MLRVTVELISANTGKKRVLGVGEIINDGQLSLETEGKLGAYRARFSKWAPRERELWRVAVVPRFDRKRRGAWDLLYLALKAAVGERNK